MTARSKIVGITRQSPEKPEIAEENEAQAIALDNETDNEELLVSASEEEEYPAYADDFDPEPINSGARWTAFILPAFLLILLAAWTGFFAWANQSKFIAMSPDSAITLLGDWALPASLIGVVWLLILRSSRSETRRFSDAALLLRNESDALQSRMRTVNEEIAVAREFLAQNALELESIGRRSASNLIAASEKLGEALQDSDAKAKTLEDVSNAATNNLEQLRKHLPVVTSAAKDVTNQIGNAGNSAQLQVKNLITALQRVAVAGEEARGNIDGMEERAAEASVQLSHLILKNSEALTNSIAVATEQTHQMASLADNSTRNLSDTFATTSQELSAKTDELTSNISKLFDDRSKEIAERIENATQAMSTDLKISSAELGSKLGEAASNMAAQIYSTSSDVDEMVESNLARLTQKVEMLRESLIDMTDQSANEDARIDEMIARIKAHLQDSAAQLESIDQNATDRSIKLAFAMEALVETTGQFNKKLETSENQANDLVTRSEQLIQSVAAARRELDEDLPSALSRADERIIESLERLQQAADKSVNLDDHSDNILAKLTTIEHMISTQQQQVNALMSSSDAQFEARRQQAESLSDTLTQAREMMDDVASVADGGLAEALNRLKESARQAAEESRKVLEEEMETVTGRLSTESQQSLKAAIDNQVSVLNDIVQKSLHDNIAFSEAATQKLTNQLAQINDMTGNLERRLADSRDSFDGIDDDSFARQMAMLTESLNSTAIDVAKILSNEVTDTSWAAYLKGDRGVFTRRAVRLLNSSEIKTIVGHYDEEPEFREQVNRYIHDFEAMMRVLLSTRDGNAIGVTLLSSDVGKLYVALAQAIERLRTD